MALSLAPLPSKIFKFQIKPGSPEFYTVIVFILSIGIQLFLYCWFGNKVTVQVCDEHIDFLFEIFEKIIKGKNILIFCYLIFNAMNLDFFQSSRLHLAAFHCNWVGSPISFQKKLIIFLRKTAEPIQMYGLQFFPMSIMTFSTVISFSIVNNFSLNNVIFPDHKEFMVLLCCSTTNAQ